MVDFSARSIDSCLLPVLQEESTRASFVTAETYMHDETSTLGLDVSIGREDTEIGRRCTRSGSYGRSRGQHIFLVNFYV